MQLKAKMEQPKVETALAESNAKLKVLKRIQAFREWKRQCTVKEMKGNPP